MMHRTDWLEGLRPRMKDLRRRERFVIPFLAARDEHIAIVKHSGARPASRGRHLPRSQ